MEQRDILYLMTHPESLKNLLESRWPGQHQHQYLVARMIADAAKKVVDALEDAEKVVGATVVFGIPYLVRTRTRKRYLYEMSPLWRDVHEKERAIADRRKQIERILRTGGVDPQTGEKLEPVPYEEKTFLVVDSVDV